MVVFVLLAGCASSAQPAARAINVGQDGAAASGEMAAADSLLLVEAIDADRIVQPGSDETFNFKVVNNTAESVPVVVVLDHASGKRWKTSLCVGKQCLLGDGSKPTVSEVFVLPPYLEQPFQAHVFVDEAARAGHQETLTLRVEPQIAGVEPQSVTLSALLAAN